MKKYYIVLFLALILSIPAFAQNINVIEPELQTVLNQKGNELIGIQIYFKSNVDTKQLEQKTRTVADKFAKKEIIAKELKCHSADNQADVMAVLKAEELNGNVTDIHSLWIINSISCKASSDVIYNLSSHPEIKLIAYDKEIQMISPEMMEGLKEVEPQLSRGTRANPVAHVVAVNADHVWELGYTGKNVIVAVLDSGTNYNHKDLADHLWTGYVDTNNDGMPDQYVNGWNFIENSSNISDDFGHGTHCAGIVCSDGTSGQNAGVAPDASLMTVKTINRAGGGSVAQMLNGVQFAVENGAQVISMSLGYKNSQLTTAQKEEIRKAFDNVLELGVVVCAAAGNDGTTYGAPDNVDYPAACPAPWSHPDQTLKGGLSSVICVGADDLVGQSSQGPSTWEGTSYNDYPYNNGESMGLIRPDISAPGNTIYSLNYLYEDKYTLKSGTSQATPCVAGVIALMLEKNPSLTPAEISQIIEETAMNKPETKNNIVGSGRIDALAAVNTVQEGEGSPFLKLVSFTPTTSRPENTTVSIIIKNDGKGASASDATATLSVVNDPYITIPDPTQTISRIGADNTKILYFDIIIDEQTPSGHIANFSLSTASDNLKWDDKFSIDINAVPNVVLQSVTPSYIKRNGSTNISVTMVNNGTAPLTSPMDLKLLTLSYSDEYLTVANNVTTIKALGIGETATGTFTLETNDNTPDGEDIYMFIETFSESTVPANYIYEFENDMQGWTCFNASNNANIKTPWWHSSMALTQGKDAKDSHSGYGHLMSSSNMGTSYYTYPIDNYLVSPVKLKATENSKVSFYARSSYDLYYAEHFGLAVSTAGNTSAADFTTLEDWVITDKTKWKEYTVDLSAYAGQEIYVALRHFFTQQEWNDTWQGYDVDALNIDDITFHNVIINTQYVPTLSDTDLTFFNVTAYSNVIDMSKVENVAAEALSTSEIKLTWDAADNAISYNVYRNGKKIANLTETNYTDIELLPNTQYCYNVTSVNGMSESELSDDVYATTLTPEGVAIPEAPIVTAEATSDSTIVLTWNEVENAVVYVVYQDDDEIAVDLTETTFTVTGLKSETQYCFKVSAVNESGESEKSENACATTLKDEDPDDEPIDPVKPEAPVLTAEALSTSEIKLTWNAVDAATSYNIYKGAFAIAKDVTDTIFVAEDLDYDTEYCFTVTAVNEAGESNRSEKVCVKTLGESLDELSASVDIYPNPAKDEIRISSEEMIEEVSIYNINGQQTTVNRQQTSSTEMTISIGNLNSGVYFIKLRTEKGESVRRILKL